MLQQMVIYYAMNWMIQDVVLDNDLFKYLFLVSIVDVSSKRLYLVSLTLDYKSWSAISTKEENIDHELR